MIATFSFLIRTKPPLLELLNGTDAFYHPLAEEVILTAQIGDRHGFEFATLFEQIKASYMASVKKSLPKINTALGFDHYWTFESHSTRVVSLNEILRGAEQAESNTSNATLNYLVQTNVEIYAD